MFVETSSEEEKLHMSMGNSTHAESSKAVESRALSMRTTETGDGKEDDEELTEVNIAIYIEMVVYKKLWE